MQRALHELAGGEQLVKSRQPKFELLLQRLISELPRAHQDRPGFRPRGPGIGQRRDTRGDGGRLAGEWQRRPDPGRWR